MDPIVDVWFQIGFVMAAILSGVYGYELTKEFKKKPDMSGKQAFEPNFGAIVVVGVSFLLGPLSMCYWIGTLFVRGGR